MPVGTVLRNPDNDMVYIKSDATVHQRPYWVTVHCDGSTSSAVATEMPPFLVELVEKPDLAESVNRLAAAIEASNAKPSPRAYRCVECGAMADTRGDHLPTCSIYVKPWAGTAPDDASGITDVTS